MRNLYSQFMMKAPGRDAMARRLTGGAPLQPASVSAAPSAFYRNVGAPSGQMNRRDPYVLGMDGGLAGLATHRGLARLEGFGALSGDPAVELVPGVNFRFDIDKKDFITGRPIHQEGIRKLGLSWTPVTPGQVTAVRNKLSELTNSTEQGATTAAALVADGADLAAQVGNVGEAVEWEAVGLGARGEVDIFGKVLRNTVESNRLNAMRRLKAWMDAVIAIPVPEMTYTPGGAGTPGANVQSAAAAAARAKAEQDRLAAQGPSKMPLYVGGALIAALGIVVVLKKRKG